MSDEKTAETLAEVKDEPTSLDEVSTETKPETKEKPEGETSEAGETAGEEQPKKPSGAQRAKLREQRLLAELNETQRRLEEATRQAPAKASETEDKPPLEADFNGDWFAWQRAMTAFEAGKAASQAIEKQFKTREDSERTTKQAEIARERAIAHAERVEDARDTITDFDQVMGTMKGVNVRDEVIDEIMSSEKSALLAYHLAKNPNKLAEMDRMSGKELAREMGRLEATIKLPTAKKQTTAPTPLEPLKGGASGSFDPEKASMDDYVAKRKAGWKG